MNTDHYVTGKSRHKYCEDYAISGVESIPYLILADGCSSSEGSHIGAMLLSLAAKDYLNRYFTGISDDGWIEDANDRYHRFGSEIIRQTAAAAESLDVPQIALDATLIMAYCFQGMVHVHVYGDGYVIAKKHDEDDLYIVKVNYETNAPYYLSYQLNPHRDQHYHQVLDHPKVLQYASGKSELLKFDHPVYFSFPTDPYSIVLIASDGLGSFVNKADIQGTRIPDVEIIREFTAFKNFNGSFIQRRMRKAIAGFEKQLIVNTDDVAIAGMITEAA